ncbi:MAG: hypothetical protein ABH830_00110 [Patescibacteria group bacterium]
MDNKFKEKFLIDFIKTVDNIYGLYLDCIYGFGKITNELKLAQINLSKRNIKKLNIFYGKGNPNKKESWPPLHKCSQYEFKERNKKDGKNYKNIANLCLVLIFDYWEYDRKKLAKKLNIKSIDIKSDIMCDIRYYRNSILKHKGKGNKEMKKCKIINFFKEGEEININKNQMDEIIYKIKNLKIDFNIKNN